MDVLSNEKLRIAWLDVLKGLTVIMVALHHSRLSLMTVSTNNNWFDYYLMGFNYYGSYVRMPAFFFCCGVVFSLVKGDKLRWFYKKRLPFMLWIILIWTFLSFTFETMGLHLYPWESYPYFLNESIFSAPYGNLWFIYALLVLSFFFSIVDRFNTWIKVLLSVLFSLIIHVYISFYPPVLLSDNGLLLLNLCYKGIPFFLLGVLFYRHALHCYKYKLFYFIFLMISFGVFSYYFLDNSTRYVTLLTRNIPAAFIFISIIIYLSKIKLLSDFLSKVGRFSLEIFVLHQFFISLFIAIINFNGINIDDSFSKFIVLLTPVVACLVFVLLSSSYVKFLFSLPNFNYLTPFRLR